MLASGGFVKQQEQSIVQRRSGLKLWITLGLAFALTGLFWGPLWTGGGLVGGDTYSYALPQKAFLADELQAGRLPLWNHLTGHGYPTLGESQTGVLYPPHLLVFSWCSPGTGQNVLLLGHYIAAFCATVWCGRTFGLQRWGSLFAALVYVYGWFPVRGFLDWAILGGVYLPLILGCAERCWQTGQRRFAIGFSFAIGLQLLGGHYQLAFLTWCLVAARTVWHLLKVPSPQRRRIAAILIAAGLLGIGLAAVQLLPTWELKGRSQRATIGVDHDPAYGHVPPVYFSQLVTPWFWYDRGLDLDRALGEWRLGQVRAGTNRVEAHCYIGLLPWCLFALSALTRWRLRGPGASVELETSALFGPRFWIGTALVSALYATGWLMPLLQSLPGFGFFRGPGRATILTTIALALLSGHALDRWLSRSRRLQPAWGGLALLVTAVDLAWSPLAVSYAVAVSRPPIAQREASPVRRLLQAWPAPVRLYAPGANLPNLLGVASTPVYLGLGPREYFDPQFTLPETTPPDFHAYTPARDAWLKQAGVTHILSFETLERRGWPVQLLWTGFDPLLNPAWARFQEPLYLYTLSDAPGRLRWDAGGKGEGRVKQFTANRIELDVTVDAPGRLILTDLAFPGWTVTVNGKTVPVETVGMFRGVKLERTAQTVVWTYWPRSVYWGAAISLVAALILLGWSGRCLLRTAPAKGTSA